LNSLVEERRFKEELYELVARIAKAAASPPRLEILEVLAQGPRTVESLARETALSVANASRHLQVLRQAGLVESRKQGTFVEYRLADAQIFDLLRVLRGIAERRLGDAERLVRSFLGERDDFEPVGRKELLARARSGSAASIAPATSRGRSRFPSTSCGGGCGSCRRGRRSSRTAAAPTASWRSTPWTSCAGRGGAPAGSWRGFPNGGPPDFRSKAGKWTKAVSERSTGEP
jgi:DNA-binding transcriptional ArsR family regulator